MEKLPSTIAALQFLKSLGVQITIDDFGTGYSSFSYLNLFPIDKLKIDKSFVSRIKSNQHDPAIINAIISMAHSLGIKVVAEGVETKVQFDYLKHFNCDEIQGYYFSQPLDVEEAQRFFVEQNQRQKYEEP